MVSGSNSSIVEPKVKAQRLRKRGGGRSGNMRGAGPAIKQIPWSVPVNPDKP